MSPTQGSPRRLSPIQPSPISSPINLPILNDGDYTPISNDDTITDHSSFNLPSLGVIINLHYRVLICINCGRAIDSTNLIDHIHQESPLLEVPPDLPSVLETAYQLVSYTSVKYSPGAIFPIFGIPLHPHPLYFCECGKGYATFETLRTHQTWKREPTCPLLNQNPTSHQGYAQRLTGNRSFFEVDASRWPKDPDAHFSYPLLFSRSLPPLRDYSNMEIKGAEDEMNTSSFFYTHRWLHHLEGYTPTDIQEVTRDTSTEVTYGELLRTVADEFLTLANESIKKENSFGILKLMGQTTG